jgi:hypothetical protein
MNPRGIGTVEVVAAKVEVIMDVPSVGTVVVSADCVNGLLTS